MYFYLSHFFLLSVTFLDVNISYSDNIFLPFFKNGCKRLANHLQVLLRLVCRSYKVTYKKVEVFKNGARLQLPFVGMYIRKSGFFQHFSGKVKQVLVRKFELGDFVWELETNFDLS